MWIRNGRVLNGATEQFEETDLLLQNGRIAGFGKAADARDAYNASGLYVIPGFIDIHIHGSVGVEFAAPREDFTKARKWLAEQGVTGFAATIRAMAPDQMKEAIRNIVNENRKDFLGAKVCGINIEGPLVSYAYKGAMNPPDTEFDEDTLTTLAQAGEGLLRMMTIVPERDRATDLIKKAVELGITPSLGHTDATYDEAMAAVAAGARCVTHVFNAMRPLSHRETGILGAALTEDELTVEMICDFVHLAPPAVKLVYRAKGAERIALISDTGFMSGLGDGEYMVDGKKRIVKNGVCRNEQGTIAGSCVSMHAGAKNLLSLGVPLEEVSHMASANPAKMLKIDGETGSIQTGYQADLIVCDADLNIKAVFVDGKKTV